MEINDIIQSKRRMVQERIEKSFGVDIEKARIAGDTKVKDGKTYVWTEYAPGKFDWQISKKKTTVNPASRKGEKEQPNIRENDKKGEYYKDYKYRASQPKTWDEWEKVLGGEVKIRSGKDIMVNGKKVGIVSGGEIFFNKPEKEQPTASVKVPRGIMMPDEDAWVEIYDKNGKKIKEDFFEDLGFDPDEEWNEKDGNYDIKGGGKMVVPKEHNTRIVEDANESIKKLEEDENKSKKKDAVKQEKLKQNVIEFASELQKDLKHARSMDDEEDSMYYAMDSKSDCINKIESFLIKEKIDKQMFKTFIADNKDLIKKYDYLDDILDDILEYFDDLKDL